MRTKLGSKFYLFVKESMEFLKNIKAYCWPQLEQNNIFLLSRAYYFILKDWIQV